jgi:hypothetical protein
MIFCAGLLPIWPGTSTQNDYSLVTDLAAGGVLVAVACRVLVFRKQGYYRWKTSPVTEGTGSMRTWSRPTEYPRR